MKPLLLKENRKISLYAFGSIQGGRNYNSNSYRFGFNGKENDNEVKGVGNSQDYGMRIYDPRLGRFLSIDPLSRKFAMLTPYQFASNTPIQAVDLDGLEAAKVKKDVSSLVIVIQGQSAKGPPPKNKTQAQNDPNSDSGIEINGISYISGAAADKPHIKVVTFSSDQSEDTKNDVLKTIKDYKALNPNGQVIIVGHSLGADNAVELVNENPEIKVDLLITLDILDEWDDDNIPSNVGVAINLMSGDMVGGREDIEVKDKTKTAGVNFPVKNTSHKNIDDDYGKAVSDIILDYTKKAEPKKEAPTKKESTPVKG